MLGLDSALLNSLHPNRSLSRIIHDLHSDFIYAPHISVVFSAVGNDLWDSLRAKLESGSFAPLLPITLEIPKASGFPRPGSTLWPFERLAYQTVTDLIAPQAEATLNREHVFSFVLLDHDPEGFMFQPSGICYARFKDALSSYAHTAGFTHCVRADVASYFERLYQHSLINLLHSAGCDNRAVNFLEKLLSLFMQKDSHGIVQGVGPSDYLGTFYLCGIDSKHDLEDITFARYADDIHAFFDSETEAWQHIMRLGNWLRRHGLNLNEAKTDVIPIGSYVTEETELDKMFAAAKDEARKELERIDFYGTTMYWDDDAEDVDEQIELAATRQLFDLRGTVPPRSWRRIEKFCLGAFTASSDPYAIDYVVSNFLRDGSLAQVYASYLRPFIAHDDHVAERVQALLSERVLYDYQLMWLYALMMAAKSATKDTVKEAIKHLTGPGPEAVRGAAAVFVGKFGDAPQRQILRHRYQDEPSAFVRAAILYASRHFPTDERKACFGAWGGHSEINSLIVKAAKAIAA